GREAGGGTVTDKARVVIGADGVHSLVARAVGAPEYEARHPRTCAYYTYWSGLELDGAELYPRDGHLVMLGKTMDGLAIAISFWPRERFHEARAEIERHFLEAFALVPPLAERLQAGERADRFYGTGDLPFYFRRPFGPGWALVGDAGYHKDPLTAEGITDAFRDADLLADALHAGFSGERPLEEALAAYELARNEDARPIYDFTYDLAGLQPPDEQMQALFAALRDNPEQTS